jgi:DNA-binding IclR family transcriptional regulator
VKSDTVPTERAGLVTWWFIKGQRLTTAEVADKLGISRQGAHSMLEKLSRIIPLTKDDCPGGKWFLVN